ncbi:MAG: hypothetical protein M1824_005631 [Vezdaea acicularis]|nr:MAG: hypothetical protein M1824_005631 [Vezdaea acicularis]
MQHHLPLVGIADNLKPGQDFPVALNSVGGEKPRTIALKLGKGEFGEAYQALVAALILKHSRHNIYINFDQNIETDIRDLFKWYDIPDRPPGTAPYIEARGKDQLTRVIHDAFKATQDPNTWLEEAELDHSNGGKEMHCDQEGLFKYLRIMLDGRLKDGMTGKNASHVDLSDHYFHPTFAAQY